MKRILQAGLTALAVAPALAVAALAQTVPSEAPPAPLSATEVVIAAQLNARGPSAGKISGGEADAIYKHYLEGIGRPLKSTFGETNSGTASSTGNTGQGGASQ